MSVAPPGPPGWYAHPDDPSWLIYWDGSAWQYGRHAKPDDQVLPFNVVDPGGQSAKPDDPLPFNVVDPGGQRATFEDEAGPPPTVVVHGHTQTGSHRQPPSDLSRKLPPIVPDEAGGGELRARALGAFLLSMALTTAISLGMWFALDRGATALWVGAYVVPAGLLWKAYKDFGISRRVGASRLTFLEVAVCIGAVVAAAAVSLPVIQQMGEGGFSKGGSAATDPASPIEDRCTQAQQYAKEVDAKVAELSPKAGSRSPQQAQAGRDLEQALHLWSNLVAGNPDCFPPDQVAAAQTYLDDP